MAKRVFISFKIEDRDQVNGLRLLAANPKFDLEFYDESVRAPYDSTSASYIKTKIGEKISRTSVTVCMIGNNTYKSDWVNWEIDKSHEKENRIIVMALKGITQATLPKRIRELGLTFHGWDPALLEKLINE